MKMAWQFVRVNGFTMSEALKQAWLNFKLKAKMFVGIVKFYYEKVDGTVREAWGTLMESRLPATRGIRKPSPLVQTYFDTGVNEYRSFKRANLIRIA